MTLVIIEPDKTHKILKMKSYNMPNYSSILIPEDWEYEVDYDNQHEQIFFPSDSDLTVRVNVFSFTKDNQAVPKERIIEIARNIPDNMTETDMIEINLPDYHTTTYYREYMEDDKLVYHILVKVIIDGKMCTYNSYCTDKNQCIFGALFINYLEL